MSPGNGTAERPARRLSASGILWRIGGSVLAVAAFGWGAFSTVDALAFERIRSTTVVAATVDVVDLRTDGSVVVHGDPAVRRVTVRRTATRSLFAADVSQRVTGGRLDLRGRCPAVNAHCSVKFEISAPPSVRVVVRAGVRVVVQGVSAVDASSGNGRIAVADIARDARLRAGNGRIEASRTPRVDARTRNGSIALDFADAPARVFARASNGSVTVVVPEGPDAYRVDVDARNGATRVGVRTDPSSPRTITAQATNGAAVVRYPQP